MTRLRRVGVGERAARRCAGARRPMSLSAQLVRRRVGDPGCRRRARRGSRRRSRVDGARRVLEQVARRRGCSGASAIQQTSATSSRATAPARPAPARSGRRARCRGRPPGAASPTSAGRPRRARRRRSRSTAMRVVRARGQDHDLVAGSQHAAGHLPGVAAVVVVLLVLRADHPLDGEPRVGEVAVAGRPRPSRGGAAAPARRTRASFAERLDDVVAVQRGDRDEGDVLDGQPAARRRVNSSTISSKRSSAQSDEVHLVDGDDEMGDAAAARR